MTVLNLDYTRKSSPEPPVRGSAAGTPAPATAAQPRDAAGHPFRWPAPPFCQRAPASLTGHDGEVELEFIDGNVVSGELVAMQPGGSSVSLRESGRTDPEHVSLAQVRIIRLRKPATFAPNSGALRAVGASPVQGVVERSFTVHYTDGASFSGTTRGFLKFSHGLYLFLADGTSGQTACCFIPRQQLKDIHIGPLLGATLVERGLVSGPDLTAALVRQARLRTELLGEYLTENAIVSADDLAVALEQQRKTPLVRLGDVLVEANLISTDELQAALAVQSGHRERRLGDILVSMGAVTARAIQIALADKLGIPYVNAREIAIDPETLALVGGRFAKAQQVLPVLRQGQSLVVATENPLAGDYEKDLGFMTGLTIVPVIANADELRERIGLEYSYPDGPAVLAPVPANGTRQRPPPVVEVDVEDLASQVAREMPRARRGARTGETEAQVSDSTLVRLVNKIITEAHAQGASDVHIESNPGRGNTRVRFRKDGDMVDYLQLQPSLRHALISRIKIMAGLDIAEHRLAQDGKINFGRFGSVAIELRVAVVPTAGGLEDVVMRILGGARPMPLDRLSLAERDLRELKVAIGHGHGLFLVCGPTGSGKTTTLHSAMSHINRPDMKIWTAEDPVEIVQPGLRQVQVHPKIGWTFAAALRSFLRADPDVIMVGEMRDAETAGIGVEASLTGHLVLSTLHTNTAAESVTRLLNLGLDPFNFADALLGVLSQRLARRLCPHCKRPQAASDTDLADLANEYCADTKLDPAAVLQEWRAEFGRGAPLKLHAAAGCDKCSNGYKGRIGVYELLVADLPVKQLIHTRATASQLTAAAQAGGMRTLRQDAIRKVLTGELDLPTARAASS